MESELDIACFAIGEDMVGGDGIRVYTRGEERRGVRVGSDDEVTS